MGYNWAGQCDVPEPNNRFVAVAGGDAHSVGLKSDEGRERVLSVSDNGVGIPKEIDFRNTSSLGLHLVNTLVGQLNGAIELYTNAGTTFEIRFKMSE